MPAKIFAAVRRLVVGAARRCGSTVKAWLRPAQSMVGGAAGVARDASRSRRDLIAENALLRQQLIVLRRTVKKRPALGWADRLMMVIFARLCWTWRDAIHVVQPDTLLRWHRQLGKLLWRRKSRPKRPPKRLPSEMVALIKAMAIAKTTWGAQRIRGELLKLGINVSKRSIQKYVDQVRPPRGTGQTWHTFIKNHAEEIWACDFLQLCDAWFRPIFAFIIIKHATREVVHFGVTRSPSDAWVAQQLRQATPWGEGPRFLVRDNDGKFGLRFKAVAEGTGIELVSIPPKSPNLNGICERFLASVRRECLDHVLILGERHLHRVLTEYVEAYFNCARPHQGIEQQIPDRVGRPTGPPASGGKVVAIPILGGLHHDYRRAA